MKYEWLFFPYISSAYKMSIILIAGSTKISNPFFSSLDNLLWDAYIIFPKGVDNFELEHKTC